MGPFGAGGLRDFRQAPPEKKSIAKYVYGGFERCLYPALEFQSDTERKLAVIIDRDSQKWFKAAKEQFQLFYLCSGEHLEYQPDFVAEGDSAIYMLEPKVSATCKVPKCKRSATSPSNGASRQATTPPATAENPGSMYLSHTTPPART
jgi:hypothetical protein